MIQHLHFLCNVSLLQNEHGDFPLLSCRHHVVSMSLCEVPAPDQELVDKYEAMKATFYKRLLNAYHKVQAATGPLVERVGENPHGQAAKDYLEHMQTDPHVQGAVKIITGVAQEAAPLVDKARSGALGAYGHYVRPHVGTYLNDGIEFLKTILDKVLPAEE